MEPTQTASQALFEQVVTIEALPRPQEEPAKPAGTENAVCRDNDVSAGERAQYKTPLAILDNWAQDQKRIFKHAIPHISIKKSYRKWSSTAHLEIETPNMLNDEGLELHFSVTCNPHYMAQPSDLIPIYLETPRLDQEPDKPGQIQLMVVPIQPTWDYNHWEIRVTYSLSQLAKLLKLHVDGPVTRDSITSVHREVALRAQWLGVAGRQMPQVNGVQHESGGLDQKGGSGKVRLVRYEVNELKGTENRRNTSWNMGEKLHDSRPVFRRYGSILQRGEEMLTSLECESEYKVKGEPDIDAIVAAMDKLRRDDELLARLGIRKMTRAAKEFKDTYFDLPGERNLLANRIVLRHRERRGEDGRIHLFAVKGASHVDDQGRRLRLAAQVQLVEAALKTAEGKATLREFLSVDWVDNPIARTLLHALAQDRQVISRLSKEDTVPTLIIESQRETFAMTLADGTVIDFSADKATGTRCDSGKSDCVYSFEFGVGHPALNQAATAGAAATSTAGDEGEQPEKQKSVQDLIGQFGPAQPQIVRPYHVPADLINPRVFARDDYRQFVQLRDAVITKVFALDPHQLELGGNKAHDLAQILGLI